jgi:hypothetical protein
MADLGFNFSVPEKWNKLWLLMWFLFTAALLALAFLVPFWPEWLLYSIPLFFIPELIGITRQNDAFPPLTHTIRHFLPNWVAFPLIYFLLGTIGAAWLEFQRPVHLGGMFALLGWLTDHFAATYARPDPFPGFDGRDMPIEEMRAQLDPPSRAF